MTCLKLMHLLGHSFLNLIFNFVQVFSRLIPRNPKWFRMPETAAALEIRGYYVAISCDFWTERNHRNCHSSDTTPHTLLPRRKSLLSLLIELLKFIIAG
jgi:hypothetical protein